MAERVIDAAARAALNSHRDARDPTWEQADERIKNVWRRTVINVALQLSAQGVNVSLQDLEREAC